MTVITDWERLILTWGFLFILGYGIFRIIHGARMSNKVYKMLPRTKRRVRAPIQTAKWLLVAHMIFLWLTIQGFLDFLAAARIVFFTGAVFTAVLISIFLDRGYTNYWDDIKGLPGSFHPIPPRGEAEGDTPPAV